MTAFLLANFRKAFMSTNNKKTGVTFNCEWCGKEVYQNLYHYNKTKHHYCSAECKYKMQHKLTHEIRECEVCGKEFECSKKSTQRFCGESCQHEWQKGNVGLKNVRFTRKLIPCEWCGNKFFVRGYKLNNQGHHFCSTKCRQEWYSNIWSQQDDWKIANRNKMIKALQDGKMSNVESAPQLQTNEILDRLGIQYINEQPFVYYAVDNYLYERNLIIEVMGDYWHVNPFKFNLDKLTKVQRDRIPKDRAKHTYLSKYHGIECLYLWERDLTNNPYLCELLIEQYYYNDGVLSDYNSFNYHIDNGVLTLNDNIVLPYFLRNKETKEAG